MVILDEFESKPFFLMWIRNKEMKPFWHKLQDRIFKPGYDQEAYMELVLPIVSFQSFYSKIGFKGNNPI